ncbi:hypothetical protein J1614_005871 [Plenodomus biglobosus]|nr:hypothetical protein J1614_005871 [Plenodomus biglobosus]
MCIIYYAIFKSCPHKEFLGSYHCGHPGCSIAAQLIFNIEDAGSSCEICKLLDGKDESGLPPVQWRPPIPDNQLVLVKRPGWAFPEIVMVGQMGYAGGDAKSCAGSYMGSLSDVNSVTSRWRKTGNGKATAEPTRAETGMKENESEVERTGSASRNSAGDTLPADPVHSPVGRAVSPASDVYSISPNTVQHRNLVHEQLAALPDVFPARPFTESPQPVSSPALRTIYLPTFSPMLPAGLPSYPVLPPGLFKYPVYGPGIIGEHLVPLRPQSSAHEGAAMDIPGLHVRPSGSHGLSAMDMEHLSGLYDAGPVQPAYIAPIERPHHKYTPTPHSMNMSMTTERLFGVAGPFTMRTNTPAPSTGTTLSNTAAAGNSALNMTVPFNAPGRYRNQGSLKDSTMNTILNMNIAGSTLNPLAPQFRGRLNEKGNAA